MIAVLLGFACGGPKPPAPGGTWHLQRDDPQGDDCPAVVGDGQSRKQREAAWLAWHEGHETAVLWLADDGGGAITGYFAGEAEGGPVDGRLAEGLGELDVAGKPATLDWTADTLTLTRAEQTWRGARCSFEDRCDDRCYP